jgi:hypothetical protein
MQKEEGRTLNYVKVWRDRGDTYGTKEAKARMITYTIPSKWKLPLIHCCARLRRPGPLDDPSYPRTVPSISA